ncbi:MAG: DUF3168 domain-containing protein [Pseudomonadota bacterium]
MILKLQEQLYKKLNINEIASKASVYFQVPQNSKFPYIFIGDFLSKDKSTKTSKLEEINFKISIYFRDKNLRNMLMLSKEIRELLIADKINFLEQRVSILNDSITYSINMQFKTIQGD